jgi:hypothetical protein
MAALTELRDQVLGGPQRVVIEAGPVRVFAGAVGDRRAQYREPGAIIPPTYPFVMSYWGSMGEGGAAGLSIEKLRGPGRMLLHGTQEFVYHRWPKVGDTLEGTTRVTDVSEKARDDGGAMEFYTTATEWKDASTGDPVVSTLFTLIVMVRPPK